MSHNSGLKVSVIIPVYNGGKNFRRCLSAITEAEPPPFEIIVVADGCTDASKQTAEEFNTTVINTPSPGGPGRARNLGAKAAEGDILFFIDADVEIKPDTLEQVVTAFSKEPDLSAVFGSYDDNPGSPNFLSQYKNLLHHYVHQSSRENASTFWGACGAIQKDLFWKTGGFDEAYVKPSTEDIELGYRMKKAGYKIRLIKSLQVKHLKKWNVISLFKTDILYRALPWAKLIMRDKMFINDLNTDLTSRLSVVLIFSIVVAMISALIWHSLLLIPLVLGMFLFFINRAFYRFLREKRGSWFMLKAIPFHWFYYFYSGIVFAAVLAGNFASNLNMSEMLFNETNKPQKSEKIK